jgi:hypothetical protein
MCILCLKAKSLDLNVYFVSQGQITQPPTPVVGQVVTARNVLRSDGLDNGHCDALLPV